ncbi:hypothetical protein MRB53_028850 [Persea americana]|uniref:Uncharacterized protein n=1 Tax=Persea americana TaxID=3435 RepID=A0ACC2KGR8_PERAE|nr:hypothetical protein MRB53_028850 [Persea americana]
MQRKTQNSGVSIIAETSSFASTRDQNPMADTIDTNGDVISWNRPDIEGVVVDANLVLSNPSQEYDGDDNFIDDGDGDDTATDDGDQD